jgi:hypothetical protein
VAQDGDIEAAIERLTSTMKWVAQTIHQAYHETGTWEECEKNTCEGIRQALNAFDIMQRPKIEKIMRGGIPNFDLLDDSEKFIVLWQYRSLGSFKTQLAETIALADMTNRAKIAFAFPAEVEGMNRYHYLKGWWQEVLKKAGIVSE